MKPSVPVPQDERRRDRAWLAGLLAVLALAFVPLVSKIGTYNVDSGLYLAGARGFVDGLGYCYSFHRDTPPIGFYPPLQSAWLALWWRLGDGFPANLPALNASMFVLVLIIAGLAFWFFRRSGIPRSAAAGLTLVWMCSPSWLGWVLALMSDMGFMIFCLATALVWQRRQPDGSIRAWWGTGLLLAIAYWWRTAAVAPIGAIGLAAAWQARRGRWMPMLAFGAPVLTAALAWKVMGAGGMGYGGVLKDYFDAAGGTTGYRRMLADNFVYCLKGLPFWEMVLPAAVRLPQWIHAGPVVRELFHAGLGIGFWSLVWLAARGWRRGTTDFDRVILLAGLAYVFQVVVMPFSAGNFHRYFFLLLPFFLIWVWRGVAGPDQRRCRHILALLVAGALVGNVALSAVIFRRQHEESSLRELREGAAWVAQNIPPDAAIAANITLPTATWFGLTGRPIVVDYLDARWFGSPIPHSAQGYARADYALFERDDQRDQTLPGLFTEVFRSSGGAYRIFRIEPDAEARFRETHRLPPPSPTEK